MAHNALHSKILICARMEPPALRHELEGFIAATDQLHELLLAAHDTEHFPAVAAIATPAVEGIDAIRRVIRKHAKIVNDAMREFGGGYGGGYDPHEHAD